MEKTLKVEKNTHDFTAEIGEEPFEWFLSGCESERKEGIMQILELAKRNDKKKDLKVRVNSLGKIMLGKEKGSVGQFARCYPEDERLKALSDIINNFTKADL